MDFRLLIFIYKSPGTFESTDLSVQQKFKIDFQDGDCCGHNGLPFRTNLAIFDLQVTQILATKFRVNWHFSSGENSKTAATVANLGVQIGPILVIFHLRHPDISYPFSSQLAFWFRRRSVNRFSRWRHGGHLGFPIGTILAIFDLLVTLMLPTKFQVS